MTRHGWYEWHPDPREQRIELAMEQVDREFAGYARFLSSVDWCVRCERFVPLGGCPACGDEDA